MIAILVILVLLGALLLTPVGARACYVENVLYLDLRLGRIYRRLLPKKQGGKKKPKKAKKKKEKKPDKESAEKKKEKKPLTFWLELVRAGLRSSKIFLRGIVIDRINARVIFAGPDPAQTAQNYGKASAAAGAVHGILQSFFRIKRYDVQLGCDFCADRLSAEGEIELSFLLWSVFGMGFGFGFAFLNMMIRGKYQSFKENRTRKKENRRIERQHGGHYERV